MSRGDVRRLELPGEGRRPVCVLTRNEAIPVLRNVAVALVTRTIRDIPTEVRLSIDQGVPAECVISLDNIRTVPKALLGDTLLRLNGAQLVCVCTAMNVATGCR